MAVLDHRCVVERRHVGHAAIAMPRVEITAKQRILSAARLRPSHRRRDIAIEFGDPPEIAGGTEFIGLDADRNTSPAIFASRPVSDGLRAPESRLGELIVQSHRPAADQMGENLALVSVRQIGTWRRCGEVKLRCVPRFPRQFQLAFPWCLDGLGPFQRRPRRSATLMITQSF